MFNLSLGNRKDFYKMLSEHAEKVQEGMSALVEFLDAPTDARRKKVDKLEEEADELRHVLMDDLNRTFVTPIDREDISALSEALDDIIDYSKSTVEEIMLFEVEPDQCMKEMAQSIFGAVKDITYGVKYIENHPKTAIDHIVRAKKTENKVEHLYRNGLVKLFKTNDVIKILKTREIYRHLSNAADRVVDVSNSITGVLIKNG